MDYRLSRLTHELSSSSEMACQFTLSFAEFAQMLYMSNFHKFGVLRKPNLGASRFFA